MIIEINKKLIVFIFSGGQNVTLGWEGALDGIAYKFGGPPKNAQYTQSQINLKTTNELKKMTIRNVVGTIRGAVEPDRYVIIGTHRDAWVHGTADALTGTAAMIEIMTAMSKTMRVCIVFELTTFFHTKFYRL